MPALVSRETLETIFHVAIWFVPAWTLVGTFIWCFILDTGVIGNVFEAQRIRQGKPVSLWFGFKASVVAIIVWPAFAKIIWRRRKPAWAAFKRLWWGGVRA